MRNQTLLSLVSLLSISLVGCGEEQATVDPSTAIEQEVTEAEEEKPVEQIADPAELAQLRDNYLRGDYPAVQSLAETAVAEWTEPNQVRAAGLAHSWLALAVSESIPEQAEQPANTAVRLAEELNDAEVLQLARIAQGVYLCRVSSLTDARTFVDQAAADTESPNLDVAKLFRAEVSWNQAFDENDKLVDRSKLVEAQTGYSDVVGSSGEVILKARASEGLAAIAKELNQKEEVCKQSLAAQRMYQEASASDYLRQGAEMLLQDSGCSK